METQMQNFRDDTKVIESKVVQTLEQLPAPVLSSYELKLKLLAENRKAAAKILSQALSRLEANNSVVRIIDTKSREI